MTKLEKTTTDKSGIRVNEQITARRVRLIGRDGEQLDIVSLYDALRVAQENSLDLVEVSPNADPPVCRIMDYGKFRFEQRKKSALAKKNQKTVEVKEIKFRPGTADGDYQVKLRNLIRFLESGDKAKVTIRFRGRELAHQELGVDLLRRIETDLSATAIVEQVAKREGRQLVMIFAPKKK